MPKRAFLAWCFCVVALAGCDDDSDDSCSTIDTSSPTYGCTPHAIDAGGCSAINYPQTETVDGAYPLGCMATFPACSGFSSSSTPVACVCGLVTAGDGGVTAEWNCPY